MASYARRVSKRPVSAQRSVLFSADLALSYFQRPDTRGSEFVQRLSQAAYARYEVARARPGSERRTTGTCEMTRIETFTLDVLMDAMQAATCDNMILNLVTTCCKSEACDTLCFKQCVVNELEERFRKTQ